MKILFLNTTGGYFGGVEQNIALSAQGLSTLGHDCHFVCMKNSGVNQEQFNSCFSTVHDLLATPLEDVVAQVKPTVIYVHKFASIQQVFDAANGIPVIRMVHDHDLYCPRKHKYYFHNHRICTRKAGLACYADLAFLEKGPQGIRYSSIGAKLREMRRNQALDSCIVGSGYMRQELIRNGFKEDKIHIIAPCVAAFEEPVLPLPKTPGILYVGQLIRGKGVDTLLKAHAVLHKQLSEPPLLQIVGTGNDEQRLKSLARELGITDSVVFVGWVAHGNLAGYYNTASLVVVPSRWPEPFGMVGVEAMLRERPVVASRVGGIPDWLADGVSGFLVDPENPEEFAQKMKLLITDRSMSIAFGKKGRELAEKQFSFEQYIQRLQKLLMGGV
jgi:glycosyltransferase involved in cell wall biosynthesis